MKPTLAITGAAGFIGSHVADLLQHYYRITAIDDFSVGCPSNLAGAEVSVVDADVRDTFAMRRILCGMDAVIHLAALTRVDESFQCEQMYRDVNYWGTRSVVDACQIGGVQHLLFSSSCAVYGTPVCLPVLETAKLHPMSPYAETKLEAEAAIGGSTIPRTTIFRIFNCYGPRQDTSGAIIAKFCFNESRGKPLSIHGDGGQTRDFVYVQDVARAFKAALDKRVKGIFNIGSGACYSVDTVHKMIIECNRRHRAPVIPEWGEERDGDIRDMQADISKAKKLLRWEPQMPLKKGIKKTFHHYEYRAKHI